MVSLRHSLRELMDEHGTRGKLLNALQHTAKREIQLGPRTPVDRIEAEVGMALDLIKNAMQLNAVPVVIKLVRCDGRCSRIVYPARGSTTSAGARRAATFVSVLKTVHTRMRSRQTATVRDVFYGNVELYGRQQVVVDWLVALEQCFGVEKSVFRILAAQKGLVHVPVPLEVEGQELKGVGLIPYVSDSSCVSCKQWDAVEAVIVVEKEAVFHRLTRAAAYCSNKIIITGKGYPDQLTRVFLYRLLASAPRNVAVRAIADSDPYGIDIVLKYCGASPAPGMQRFDYGGIFIRDLIDAGVCANPVTEGCTLQDMSLREWKMAQKMLIALCNEGERGYLSNSGAASIRRELQWQLLSFKKGEMNAIM
ncbi:ADR025Wp [Eremothecium gossypii ATCC 10895]|uniref:DNA topoisomerase (ATP-hydrolyzing) n=1 Tax=Eremothecium gossypii (strain ATCC 10895 / CBS 109.51 / FGSC 9923 / NRRL Y-1056) TaxID=284811 RepID=Q75A93_EREGS|nr:ADR025Wp [Eremothecium gossypii ATCC 10895]AAS51945.1 ADR025Wp [Eremothecium gossypii ATCC 10895]AEY96245.1 FADR025Wp [Eremothecium gossypii FDAG1]